MKCNLFSKQKRNNEIKESSARDNRLLKKSSLAIPLLPEREEDKKMASLLSMKLKPSKSILENTESIRTKIISQSSLPVCNFSRTKEEKAIRILKKSKSTLGIVHKRNSTEVSSNGSEKRPKLSVSLVGDYGTSSESD